MLTGTRPGVPGIFFKKQNRIARHDRHRVAVPFDYVVPPPRQGFATPVLAMLTALRLASLGFAPLRVAARGP